MLADRFSETNSKIDAVKSAALTEAQVRKLVKTEIDSLRSDFERQLGEVKAAALTEAKVKAVVKAEVQALFPEFKRLMIEAIKEGKPAAGGAELPAPAIIPAPTPAKKPGEH